MNKNEAKMLVTDVFQQIEKAKTAVDIKNILKDQRIEEKNKVKDVDFPRIEFKISSEEIEGLINQGIIDNDFNFRDNVTSIIKDPLAKLLYAIIWKNGDLKKIKHIIKGIMASNFENEDRRVALVFYQFGKYLSKTPGQPIIDQHVLRAFSVKEANEVDVDKLRKLKLISMKEQVLINNYIKWISLQIKGKSMEETSDICYNIDKVLFAVGKTIKLK